NRIIDVPLNLSIEIRFSAPLDPQTITSNTVSIAGVDNATLTFMFSDQDKILTITRAIPLVYLSRYVLSLSPDIRGAGGELFGGLTKVFFSAVGNHTSGLPAKND